MSCGARKLYHDQVSGRTTVAAPAEEEVDVEFSGDVLNLGLGARGTFVLNKQGPNRQIWLSSPISGPLRYDFCMEAAEWQHTRDGRGLLMMLADDFEALTGERLAFGELEDELRAIVDEEGSASR